MASTKPEIKVDPANAENTDMAQLEEFEDDHDLYIPNPDGQQAWLVKVPAHLWKAWAEIYADADDAEPIEIGKMRVYNLQEGQTESDRQIQIKLNPGVPQHVELPKNYDLNLKSEGYNNTVVFSEKDLPGHQARQNVAGRSRSHLSAARPSGITKSDRYGTANSNKVGGNKPGSYRSAIPKQTALAPMIQHVADATPIQDASYDAWFEKSYAAAQKPKRQVHIHHGIDRGMHPGNRSANFTLSSRPPGTGRKPKPKEKAVRMSQQDLLDKLYQCFKEYKYWPLKALKNRLKQPETFIKQTLESIAILVRSGDFAMNYKLRDEYASMAADGNLQDIKPDEAAPVKSEDEGSMPEDAEMDSGSQGGEDVEDEFEDIKMEA